MSLTAFAAEILFVGHSLIGTDLPPMVEAAERLRGHETSASYQIINGAPLRWNWDRSAEAEGVDARKQLATGKVDTLILTEAIPLQDQIQWNDSAGYAGRFLSLAQESNPEAQGFLLETWHSLDMGHDAWRKALVDDVEKWRGIVDGVNATLPEGAKPMRMIPAGQALNILIGDIEEGRVPGLTSARDLFSDDIHSNDRGHYLTAMVTIAALGEDPTGLPPRLGRRARNLDTVVTDQMAVAMQSAANRAVAAERASEAERFANPPAVPATTIKASESPPESAAENADPAAVETAVAPPALDDPPFPGVTRKGIGFGLNGIADWSSQQPFLDLVKSSRPWTGHQPGQFGGWGHDDFASGGWLDENGWLKAMPPGIEAASLFILTDLPENAGGVRGRYRITWEGEGKLTVGGRAQNQHLDGHSGTFDFTPGPAIVDIRISDTDPADPIRNIRVVREDWAERLDKGEIFNPYWLDRVRGTEMVRFMDWMATNDSPLVHAADRPKVTDYTWGRTGVPAEIMVALANELDADGWFTMPHMADDEFVREYAQIVRDGLKPDRRAWIEFSNEVWNWQFKQAGWADEQAQKLWRRKNSWVQFYALRAAQVADIWAETFDDPDRLMRVIATQTGWIGLEQDIINPPRVGRNLSSHFDAYAITGYFSGMLGHEEKRDMVKGWLAESLSAAAGRADAEGLTGQAREAFIARNRFDAAIPRAIAEIRNGAESGKDEDTINALLHKVIPYHREVAEKNGLKLAMYEGGTHVVGIGPMVDDQDLTEFFLALNYSDGMAGLYDELLTGWASQTDLPFNAFVDVATPSRWGSWGALRHLGDDNPRWQVLSKGN